MTRFKLTIEYKGTGYCGWQTQGQGEKTIQETIENAIFGFSGQRVKVTGAGRTDSGVHARGQVAHFDFDNSRHNMDGYALAKAINAFLKEEAIAVIRAEEADSEFHARFGAKQKLYTYSILNRPAKPAIDTDLVWHIGKSLNVEAMQHAAQHLIGTHDFTSFRAAMCQAKSPIKTIDDLKVEKSGDYIFIHAFGQSFLHHMVRNIAGTLVLVGEGK
ncbi:MAG: tRNA pseudouridine(38-40) synthase TruA, partial [Micavibrio aeruginosavorus]